MGFLNEQGKIEPIPEHIQNAIDRLEKDWFDKMKKLDRTYKKQITQYQKQVLLLQSKWIKLKEYIENDLQLCKDQEEKYPSDETIYFSRRKCEIILDKIFELEKEVDNE